MSKPDYRVSTPVERNGKTFWQDVGSGWSKEKGISIELNANPINGKLFLSKFEPKPKSTETSAGKQTEWF